MEEQENIQVDMDTEDLIPEQSTEVEVEENLPESTLETEQGADDVQRKADELWRQRQSEVDKKAAEIAKKEAELQAREEALKPKPEPTVIPQEPQEPQGYSHTDALLDPDGISARYEAELMKYNKQMLKIQQDMLKSYAEKEQQRELAAQEVARKAEEKKEWVGKFMQAGANVQTATDAYNFYYSPQSADPAFLMHAFETFKQIKSKGTQIKNLPPGSTVPGGQNGIDNYGDDYDQDVPDNRKFIL